MKTHFRSVFRSITGLVCAAALCGCEDADSRQRNAVQAQIQSAAQNLKKALIGDASDGAGTQSLSGIVSELGRIEAVEPGQNAAKAMLTATALREIAAIRFQDAERLESQQRLEREAIATKVAGVAHLSGIVTALESVSSTAEQEGLNRDLQAARAEIIEVRTRLDELDGPISEHALQIAAAKRQVNELRLSVNDLRRRAQELGHANGLETYLQAVDASRQADQIEYDIAQREIDLDYSLTPELIDADTEAQQLDSMIKAIEEALGHLNAFSQATAQEISTTRQRMTAETEQIAAALGRLAEQKNTELDPAYEEAAGALERASGQLRQVQGESAQAARASALEVQQALGRLHWSRSRALADHLRLLELMKAADENLARAVDSATVSAITAAHEEAREQAKVAYTSAQELSSQLMGGGGGAALANQLGQVVTSLGGTPMATTGMDSSEESIPQPTPDASGSMQFQSPQELLAFWGRAQTDPAAMRASSTFMHATTPDGQRWVKASTDVTNSLLAIDDAMKAKFGTGLMEQLGPMAAMMSPDYSTATPVEQTDDRAVYSFQQMGQSLKLVLRRVDGGWKMDFDELDPMMAAALPQMEQMSSALAQGTPALVSRIQSGEFTTAQEVTVAFGQIMMNASGGMGGAGGMPSSPPGGM